MSTAPSAWSELSKELSAAAAQAAASVVQVHGRPRPATGIVWAAERVLSTSHSVEWDDGIRVRRDDDTVLPAEIVGHDPSSDIVLLKVPGLDAPALSTATVEPQVAEIVLLTGRAWSGRQHARVVAITGIAGPIQTAHGPRLERVITLPVTPYAGFSGGALIGPDGRLIGVATAGLMRGRALALPVSVVQPVVEALERHGGVRRGYLGVVTQPVRLPERQRGSLPLEGGLLVLEVAAGSPADASGLLVGDVIVGAAGKQLAAPEDLLALLGSDRVAQPLPLELIRGTARETMSITVGERTTRR